MGNLAKIILVITLPFLILLFNAFIFDASSMIMRFIDNSLLDKRIPKLLIAILYYMGPSLAIIFFLSYCSMEENSLFDFVNFNGHAAYYIFWYMVVMYVG